jgi:hypothetical protein
MTPATGNWTATRSPSSRPGRCGGAARSAPMSGKPRPLTALADTPDAPPVGRGVGDRPPARFRTSARWPRDTPASSRSSTHNAARASTPLCSERNPTRSSGGAADPAATDGKPASPIAAPQRDAPFAHTPRPRSRPRLGQLHLRMTERHAEPRPEGIDDAAAILEHRC